MNEFGNIKGFYFVGIGGIGMSALAFYFTGRGSTVAGYDRTRNQITESLETAGCNITYIDETCTIPEFFRDPVNRNVIQIVFTPAIPPENNILTFFRDNGYSVLKRSEVLGTLSSATDTIAVAGTHGKTTVSTMTAHLLKQSAVDCSAFLGGISKNYSSNLITGSSRYTVMEADEYDKSFHRLKPLIEVITAVDPDHLEVYGTHESMISAYNEFIQKIRQGGILIYNCRIRDRIKIPSDIRAFSYGECPDADYRYSGIENKGDHYLFTLNTPVGAISNIHFPFPGKINIENLTAAIAVAMNCGVSESEIRKAAVLFQGVRRRFDIRIDRPGFTYIDDYAHHPEEIRAFIESVREYFGNRKTTAIFQPHLFTRTRDHAEGFANILDKLDEVILLPVYPAREQPIPGVSSGMIFERMKLGNKRMLEMKDIPAELDASGLDVLLTIGAGDIDRLVAPIEKKFMEAGG